MASYLAYSHRARGVFVCWFPDKVELLYQCRIKLRYKTASSSMSISGGLKGSNTLWSNIDHVSLKDIRRAFGTFFAQHFISPDGETFFLFLVLHCSGGWDRLDLSSSFSIGLIANLMVCATLPLMQCCLNISSHCWYKENSWQ